MQDLFRMNVQEITRLGIKALQKNKLQDAEKIFKSLLNHFEYFENKPHIGVGVSGGPDSIALVYLLNKWIKYKKGKLTAIVFDHCIRHNSNFESLQVKKMLIDLGIQPIIIRPNKNKPIK